MRRRTALVAAAILVATACRDGGSDGREGLHRLDDRALDVAGMPARVVALQAGGGDAPWLAVGDSPEGNDGRVATMWRSGEALAWDRVPLAEGGGAIVRGVARQGDTVVLVGDRGEGGSGPRAPVVWVARGEADPTVVPGGLPARGSTVLVRQVVGDVAGGRGFLALGTVDGRITLWRSANGGSWAAVEDLDVFGRGSAVAQLVATGSGVVAVGAAEGAPAAWWSPDGAVWARAAFSGGGRGRITAAVAGPDGLLAAGSITPVDTGADRRPLPSVWRSPDGQSWAPVEATFAAGSQQDNRGSEIKALVRAEDGYVATGGGTQARRVWSSPDGVTWAEADLPPAVRAATRLDFVLLAVAGTDVLVASSLEVFPPRLVLRRQGRWLDASVATPLSAPRPVAVDSGVVATADGFLLWANLLQAGPGLAEEGGGARLWRSTDGRRWQPVGGSEAFDLGFVQAMAPDADGGLVAVGTEPSVAPVLSQGAAHARTWVSSDGESWLPDDAAFRGEPLAQTLTGVARRDARVVAVGSLTRSAIDFDAVFWARDGSGPWRRIRGVPSSEGDGPEGVSRACAGRSGWLALGTGSETPVAWASADGEQWDPVDDPGLAAAGGDIRTCIGVGSRLLAVGSARGTGSRRWAAAWNSVDGRSWTPSASPALQADVDLRIDRVAADGNDVVAAGGEGQGANRPVALWRSSDCGGSWDRAPVDDRAFSFSRERAVTGVALRDGLTVLSGIVDGQVAVWTVPLADLPSTDGDGRNCASRTR